MPDAPFAFVAEPLDRADLLRRDARALARLRDSARCLWLDPNGHVQGSAEDGLLSETGAPEDAIFLGLGRGQAWFAASAPAAFDAGLPQLDLRSAAALWPAFESTLFAQARALLHWRSSHRFCPACGHALDWQHGGWQGQCAKCGRIEYPRSDPAVIVALSDGERLLLGRQASWPARRYSTIAGFVEPGETLEQALRRETYEETRVRVKHCRYLASQPWPFPGALMLGFLAAAEPDEPQTAQDELEAAHWFSREAVQAALADASEEGPLRLPPPISIARWLIARWAAGERA